MPLPLKLLGEIFQFLNSFSDPIHIVGGFIRERFFQRLSGDIDIVIAGNAGNLAKYMGRQFRLTSIPLDRERDIWRIMISARQNITLDIAPLMGQTLQADLEQRDLTINAIAAPVQTAFLDLDIPFQQLNLEDPLKGSQDLSQGIIRGIQAQNFDADPLRLLRIFRFAARLGFDIEPQTLSWIAPRAQSLKRVASERILHELELIFEASNLAKWLRDMHQVALIEAIFSEIDITQYWALPLLQIEQFERDLLQGFQEPQLAAYFQENMVAQRPRLVGFKFFLLLKPLFQQCEDADKMISNLGEHFCLGRKEEKFLCQLWQGYEAVLNALQKETLDKVEVFHLFKRFQHDVLGISYYILIEDLCQGHQTDFTKSAYFTQIQYLWRCFFDPNNALAHPQSVLNGTSLLNHYPQLKGPLIGQILLAIQEAQIQGLVTNETEALEYVQKYLLANNGQEIVS